MANTHTGTKTPSRQGEYARLATLLPKAVEELGKLINSPHPNIRLGAINKVLDKCLPDIKAIELTGREGKDLEVKIQIVRERELPKGKE